MSFRLQFDATDFDNRLNPINSAGLFSVNSIAPPRSYSARLRAYF
jgi:hypothetical protein